MKIKVNTEPGYEVISGKLENLGEILQNHIGISGCKILIVTDTNVAPVYLSKVMDSLGDFNVRALTLHAGEATKNIESYSEILEKLVETRFTSSDILIALGGGMIGDLTGFAAATYLRGIRYVQVPTTLLAAVDSSVGGKTAVNLKKGKNMVGAFYQPALVVFDKKVISTLSDDAFLDGMAEIIKYGVIRDREIFEMAAGLDAEARNTEIIDALVERSVDSKKHFVEADVRDKGLRRTLNYGHTLGHAIERVSNFGISHGHAVAMGMDFCAKAARTLEWSQNDCYEPIHTLLTQMGYPLGMDKLKEICGIEDAEEMTEAVFNAAIYDKKRRGDEMTVVVANDIGYCYLKSMGMDEFKIFVKAGLNEQDS